MNVLLILTAAGLGLLAFFEPCTIATHTLFAARANHDPARRRWVALAQLVLSRTAVLAAIFGIAAWVGLETLPANVATAMLTAVGAVYLVSRKIYLPIPHIEFFRLIPRHDRLPHALRLGLTLPACTLPLVAVVAILSALTRQPFVALFAGLVFSGAFSLPTVWDSVRGFTAAHRMFLSRAAGASPYVTALLLWGGAWIIWSMRI